MRFRKRDHVSFDAFRMIRRLKNAFVREYCRAYADLIYKTPPVRGLNFDEFDVHTLSCERDFLMSLWALKSFYSHTRFKPRLFIHDDGSLHEDSKALYKHHFDPCIIVDRVEADREADRRLAGFPYSKKYRREELFGLKLFDFHFFSPSQRVLMFDTDVFFFRPLEDLISVISSGSGFYLADYQNAYSLETKVFRDKLLMNIVPALNAGLLCFPLNTFFDHNLVEDYLTLVLSCKEVKRCWIEQTAYALLVTRSLKDFIKLDRRFSIGSYWTSDSIAHHFVSDPSRDELISRAYYRLAHSLCPSLCQNPVTLANIFLRATRRIATRLVKTLNG